MIVIIIPLQTLLGEEQLVLDDMLAIFYDTQKCLLTVLPKFSLALLFLFIYNVNLLVYGHYTGLKLALHG